MTHADARRRPLRDDEGLTMVELIIYMALSTMVATIIVFLFIGTLKAQDGVTGVTQASSRGQAISQGMDRAVRTAKAVDIYTDGSGNQVLVVWSRSTQPCQAWRVTPAGALEVASGAGFAHWGTLADKVQPISGQSYFGRDGTRVRYTFAMVTSGKPVEFEGAVAARGTLGTVGTACS